MEQTVKLTYMGNDLEKDAKDLNTDLKRSKKGHLQTAESGFKQDENGDLILICSHDPDLSLQLMIEEHGFEWNPS